MFKPFRVNISMFASAALLGVCSGVYGANMPLSVSRYCREIPSNRNPSEPADKPGVACVPKTAFGADAPAGLCICADDIQDAAGFVHPSGLRTAEQTIFNAQINDLIVNIPQAMSPAQFYDGERKKGESSDIVQAFPPSLSQKARIFQDRAEKALSPFGLVGKSGDTLIWTGIYVAAQADRYAATRDPDALKRMEKSLWGLHALSEVTGIPGLIARNIEPRPDPNAPLGESGHIAHGPYEGYLWRGDVSWDQYHGYIHGVSEAWPYIQDPVLKELIREDVRQVGQHFIKNGEKIIGLDTYLDASPYYYEKHRWPKLLRALGWVRYELPRTGNAMNGVHLIQAAAYITEDPDIDAYYREKMIQKDRYHLDVRDRSEGSTENLVRRHLGTINRLARRIYGRKYGYDIRATADSLRSDVALNLGHIQLYDLARMEQDPAIRQYYLDGLKGTHEAVARHSNTYWNFLYASQISDDPAAVPDGIDSLNKFPMDNYGVRKNSDNPAFAKYKGLQDDFFKAKPPWQWYAEKPLPFEKRPMHSFAWQNNAMQMDGSFGGDDAPGVAYLAAYWLGRAHGFIDAEE